jgi:hypothetical protein
MQPNRVVAVLTPLLFAPLAGAVAAWLAEHFPGFQVDKSALEEVFIAGALIALAPAAQWLHGWQKFEARQAELDREAMAGDTLVPADPVAEEASEEKEAPDLDLGELAELDELAEMDDFDAQLLAEDEEPAFAGS